MNNDVIPIYCSKEIFTLPITIEWKKYIDDKIKPGDVILEVVNSQGEVINKVKSISHGKITKCLTTKKCEILSLKSPCDEQIFEFKAIDKSYTEKAISVIIENQGNDKLHLGDYLCEHNMFLSNMCVDCGYILNDTSNTNNNSNKYLMNAGFLSNNNDIKFNKDYVTEKERSFIYELLYIKKKLNLVLDLDNTLIHATSNLPENIKKIEFVDIKEIMQNKISYDLYERYYGNVVLLGLKTNSFELLPKDWDKLPHYSSNNHQEIQIYFKLLESLIFCIPFNNQYQQNDKNNILYWNNGFYKLRPGVLNMLKTLSDDKYEIYMYTMGTEYHAFTSLRILDPELRFFHPKRIFYRNNGFKDTCIKSLSTLFPHDHRTLVILDDIEQAWTDINSLLKVYPYHFFPSNTISNDSNNYSRYISLLRTNNKWNKYSKKKRFRQEFEASDIDQDASNSQDNNASESINIIKEIIKNEKDQQLTIFQEILIAIYKAYFLEFESVLLNDCQDHLDIDFIQKIYKYAPNITDIIRIMRKNVLSDCNILFTGFKNKFLYPFSQTDLYKWCRYFGSNIIDNDYLNTKISPTHCICEQFYTQKYYQSVKNNIPCINILWLETIIYTWIKPSFININNKLYRDPKSTEYYTPFETIDFAKNTNTFIEIHNYHYIDLFNKDNIKKISDQLWEEVFDDISLPLENSSLSDTNSESN